MQPYRITVESENNPLGFFERSPKIPLLWRPIIECSIGFFCRRENEHFRRVRYRHISLFFRPSFEETKFDLLNESCVFFFFWIRFVKFPLPMGWAYTRRMYYDYNYVYFTLSFPPHSGYTTVLKYVPTIPTDWSSLQQRKTSRPWPNVRLTILLNTADVDGLQEKTNWKLPGNHDKRRWNRLKRTDINYPFENCAYGRSKIRLE